MARYSPWMDSRYRYLLFVGGCGQNFELKIVSPMFEGKTTLQKHRMVNEALKDQIALVHAFSQVRNENIES